MVLPPPSHLLGGAVWGDAAVPPVTGVVLLSSSLPGEVVPFAFFLKEMKLM